jgi:photosystem II stability/assembly factor-like uncharacterized protein
MNMDNKTPRSTWFRFAINLLLLCLGLLTIIGLSNAGSAFFEPAAAASTSEVVVSQPVLTPIYTTLCDSNWYTLPVAALNNQTAYLTRSVNDPTKSTNRGEWRPNLPQDGIYQVEAFVPSHSTILWCSGSKITRDTFGARYTINYTGGQNVVMVNQYPLNDEWYPLGQYPFSQGAAGSVGLTDLTTDTVTRTVAFSAMRFTWLRSIPSHYAFLPVVDNGSVITLTRVWTADPAGNLRDVFKPGEAMRIYASGNNPSYVPVEAGLKISLSGPCGSGTLFEGRRSLLNGDWTEFQNATTPNCTGVFTTTVSVTYQGVTSTLNSLFLVSAGSLVLHDIPAFDKCTVPTIPQMQTWRDYSPYQAINIYIGGITYWDNTCHNSNLNAAWVLAASQQGWSFIPTWVGPQAPCYGVGHMMSWDASATYKQGRTEADSAYNAATLLGLSSQSILYYDLEAYANNDATGCRAAVKSFINGWVERLHERGARAGVYGGDCSSYINDWYTVSHIPDDAWVASWYDNPHFDPNASVYDLRCLTDNNKWGGHRIRQYAGNFKDTWGGLRITIDADVVDGEVTIVLPARVAATSPSDGVSGSAVAEGEPGSTAANPQTLLVQNSNLSAFQPLADGQGWALAGNRLLWYAKGQGWKEITPSAGSSTRLLSAFFLENHQGWSVLQDLLSGQLTLMTTSNAGSAWQAAALAAPDARVVASASLDFLDAQTGWLSLKYASGSSFSVGTLFKTTDGGKSWQQLSLPIGEPVYFIDANRGWAAGGPAGNELFSSRDGGATWQPQSLGYTQDVAAPIYQSLPYFTSPTEGWLAVTVADPLKPHVDLYTTHDAGDTWAAQGTVAIDPALNPATAVSSAVLNGNHWLLGGPGKPALFSLPAKGSLAQSMSTRLTVSGLPAGAVQIHTSSTTGWALVNVGDCLGYKPKAGETTPPGAQPFQCASSASLWETLDGGASWSEITPGVER